MRKILNVLSVLFVLSLLTLPLVSALGEGTDLTLGTIRVNGDEIDYAAGEYLAVEEGQTLDIRVGIQTGSLDVKDIEVEAEIRGYEYSDYENLQDNTHLFDLQAGTTKYVDLSVALPYKLEKEEYWLRISVLDQNTARIEKNIRLAVEPARNAIEISDVVLSPGTTIKAGRSLLATVQFENYGDKTQKDVKVTVEAPALGVSASEFVDVVETDNNNVEFEDVPEMFLPIPANAAAGEYDVKVTAKYDHYETVSKTFTIKVLANEMYQVSDKLVLAVGPESQVVMAGKTATYAIALTNAGTTSKAYFVEAMAGSEWATMKVSDSLVVLEPGKNKIVYVDAQVSATADAGEHVASVTIKSGNDVLQTLALKANVAPSTEAGSSISLRNGLEIALIILVVVLVIVGLIIGFSRLRKDDEVEGKNYY